VRRENEMGMLEEVETGTSPAPQRVLLFGPHGIGKSTWPSKAPSPIYIQTEDGLGEIDCAKFPLAATLKEVTDAIKALYTEEHEYKTLVVDTCDWLERLIHAEVCRSKMVESIDDIGYGKGYGFAVGYWKQLLDGLSALRKKRKMMMILLAHADIQRFENPETDPYDRYVPRLHKKSSAMVQEWCDEVLFANWRVHAKKTEGDFGKVRIRGIGTGQRVIHTVERPTHLAKSRIVLPEELPLEWSAFAECLSEGHL